MQRTPRALRASPERSSRRRLRTVESPLELVRRPEPDEPGFFQDPAFRSALRAAIAVALVVATLYLVSVTWTVVRALFIAAVLATMLWPWVTRATNLSLGRWHLPRALAVALIYVATIAFTLGTAWLAVSSFVPLVDPLLASYPQQTAFIREYLEPFRQGNIAEGAARVVEGAANGGEQSAATPSAGPVDLGPLVLSVLGGLLNTVLILIFAFFLLLEGGRFSQWIVLLLPKDRRPEIRALGLRIRDRASRWVLATMAYASLSAAILTIGLGVIGLPNPWLFGILGAGFALIPGLGVGLAAIPAAFLALSHSTWQAAAVVAFGALLHIADATFIAPKIFGNMLRLPTFVVFVAILLGTELLGFWGAILALPLAAGIQLILQEVMGRPTSEPTR